MTLMVSTALVAEDTELGRWAVAHAFQGRGFDTYLATSVLDALGWCERLVLSVIVLALRVDSDDAAAVIRTVRRLQPDAVVVVLAEPDDVRRIDAACGPLATVLAKPLDVDAIVRLAETSGLPWAEAQGA